MARPLEPNPCARYTSLRSTCKWSTTVPDAVCYLPAGNLPDSYRLIPTRRYQSLTIRCKPYTRNRMIMSMQCFRICILVRRVPKFYCEIRGACHFSQPLTLLFHLPINVPCISKSTSMTALVCPLTVRSKSPLSQSQILTVASSDAEAKVVHRG